MGPLFGFGAGWIVDRFGARDPRDGRDSDGRPIALVGLGSISNLGMFYFFYLFNALGYV